MYAVPPQDINIQPAQFQNFAQAPQLDGIAPENIDLIMDCSIGSYRGNLEEPANR